MREPSVYEANVLVVDAKHQVLTPSFLVEMQVKFNYTDTNTLIFRNVPPHFFLCCVEIMERREEVIQYFKEYDYYKEKP